LLYTVFSYDDRRYRKQGLARARNQALIMNNFGFRQLPALNTLEILVMMLQVRR
jgi:hypothetical protein